MRIGATLSKRRIVYDEETKEAKLSSPITDLIK